MESCVEPFGHDVSYILPGRNIFNCETVIFLDLVSDPVVLDIHVLRSFKVHDGPICDVDHGLVIAQYELFVG